jgi:hypothetical protein
MANFELDNELNDDFVDDEAASTMAAVSLNLWQEISSQAPGVTVKEGVVSVGSMMKEKAGAAINLVDDVRYARPIGDEGEAMSSVADLVVGTKGDAIKALGSSLASTKLNEHIHLPGVHLTDLDQLPIIGGDNRRKATVTTDLTDKSRQEREQTMNLLHQNEPLRWVQYGASDVHRTPDNEQPEISTVREAAQPLPEQQYKAVLEYFVTAFATGSIREHDKVNMATFVGDIFDVAGAKGVEKFIKDIDISLARAGVRLELKPMPEDLIKHYQKLADVAGGGKCDYSAQFVLTKDGKRLGHIDCALFPQR